jgi:hypothetical protein
MRPEKSWVLGSNGSLPSELKARSKSAADCEVYTNLKRGDCESPKPIERAAFELTFPETLLLLCRTSRPYLDIGGR